MNTRKYIYGNYGSGYYVEQPPLTPDTIVQASVYGGCSIGQRFEDMLRAQGKTVEDYERGAIISFTYLSPPPVAAVQVPIDATIAAKSLTFLAEHRNKLLIVGAIAYGIYYDHYHENHLGKMVSLVKSRLSFLCSKIQDKSPQSSKQSTEEQDTNHSLRL